MNGDPLHSHTFSFITCHIYLWNRNAWTSSNCNQSSNTNFIFYEIFFFFQIWLLPDEHHHNGALTSKFGLTTIWQIFSLQNWLQSLNAFTQSVKVERNVFLEVNAKWSSELSMKWTVYVCANTVFLLPVNNIRWIPMPSLWPEIMRWQSNGIVLLLLFTLSVVKNTIQYNSIKHNKIQCLTWILFAFKFPFIHLLKAFIQAFWSRNFYNIIILFLCGLREEIDSKHSSSFMENEAY